MKSIHELLEVALERRASDLVLKAGLAPVLRIDGQMVVTDLPVITADDSRELAYGIIFSAGRDTMLNCADEPVAEKSGIDEAERRMQELQSRKEIDLVFTVPRMVRVRANLYLQRGSIGAALRIIPLHPHGLDELRLPSVLKDMAMQPQGLIIITGPTGSGKTTTLAALIEEVNRRRSCNIFTIEDPVEYVFEDRKSVIHQREIGRDTDSFAAALRAVMRESPDVIAIGELRDAGTMDVAMTASEIGHLVVATLHTVSAAATVTRILNCFPEHLRRFAATQLAASLLCITSQRLVPRACGQGRVPAVEVLTNSPTVRKQIEDGDSSELHLSMRDSQLFGMNTMNQALERLYSEKEITAAAALQASGFSAELKQMLRHI